MSPAELAKQVKLLEITTRRIVTEVFAGEYSSAFKGRGMEFADVREYQPGDDVRSIDWNVTARAGRPFIKRFTEERELSVLLTVDLSGSGAFGTAERTKRELCCEIAALLIFAAVKKGDRAGLLIFTDHVEHFIPPRKGSRHALRLIRELLAFEPEHSGTRFMSAAEHITHVIRRRSLVFLVSDFLAPDLEPAVRRLAPRHDLVAIDMSDPRDFQLEPAGLMDIEDPETGRTMLLDTSSRRVRDAYHRGMMESSERRTRLLQQMGIDRLALTTTSPYVHELVRYFKQRERRMNR